MLTGFNTDIEYDGVDLLVLDPLPGVSTYSIKIPTSATAGTLVKADCGKRVKITAAILVPYNIFADEDVVMIYNNSAGAHTITEDTAAGLVMRLSGTATTGNRTLAQRGTATIVFNSGSDCAITGAGLT